MSIAYKKRHERIRFLKYFAYAFLMPSIITAATGITEKLQLILQVEINKWL